MNPQSLRTQARALSMALFVTVVMLASVNHLATSPAPAGLVAQTSQAAPQV